MEGGDRHRTLYLKAGLVIAFLILAGQLFRLQLLDNSFKVSARNNALYYQTRYPARGLILDRNGKVLVGNKNSYDILVTPRYIKELDTAALCSALNIKPVMGSTPQGTICQLGQARGMKRALAKMTEQIARDGKRTKEKVLAIAHCNCPERAREVERMILDKIRVRDSFIVDTAGISTMYANDGGIIVVL